MFRKPFRILIVLFCCASSFATAEEKIVKKSEEPKVSLSQAEKRMASMRGTLKRLLKELAEARKNDDVRRVNCLTVKLNTVKALVRASEKAHVVLLEATYGSDQVTAQSFGQKIVTYSENVDEISQTFEECSGAEVKSEGATLVYVRPEDSTIPADVDNQAWDKADNAGSTESYPVAPPASPFR